MDNHLKIVTDNAIKQLVEALESGHSETLRAYLRTMGMFHRYSMTNCLLIYLQKPEATKVAGFATWKKMGRFVKKGERGIRIIVPLFCKSKAQPETETGGEDTILAFGSGHVFDVSQTEGEPLPDFETVKGDPGCHLMALHDHVRELGIERVHADVSPAFGVSYGGKIAIQENLPPAEEFAVLVHELAHELLHRDERRSNLDKRQRELEAEAVSFVVCSGIGLENTSASIDYIQLYQGSAELLMSSLRFIQEASSQILET